MHNTRYVTVSLDGAKVSFKYRVPLSDIERQISDDYCEYLVVSKRGIPEADGYVLTTIKATVLAHQPPPMPDTPAIPSPTP